MPDLDMTVPPALTPAQWAEVRTYERPHEFDDAVASAPAICHYLVALNNAALPDGDSRKITQADVELVAALAHGWDPKSPEARRILALRDKMAALLPE